MSEKKLAWAEVPCPNCDGTGDEGTALSGKRCGRCDGKGTLDPNDDIDLLRDALTAATVRVRELGDALEIIEGDCLRKSDDPATTLFHIYTTARAARDQEEPRDR